MIDSSDLHSDLSKTPPLSLRLLWKISSKQNQNLDHLLDEEGLMVIISPELVLTGVLTLVLIIT